MGDFDEVLANKAYGELNQLLSIYHNTEGLENCIHLMQPGNFSMIVVNASKNLSDLCFEIYEMMYEYYYNHMDSDQAYNLRPSNKIHKALYEDLVSHCQSFEMDINHYEIIFSNLISQIESARSKAPSIGGAAIGGVVGSLFGPVGTFIGSLAGSSMSSQISVEEINRLGSQLCNEFARITESTNNSLEFMANRIIGNINKFKEVFSNTIEYRC